MEDEKDAFYVVRKGDIVGIYKSLSDCQAQAGTSVCNPSVSVYKGYSLPKETEKYLVSHGLKNASYTISAANVSNDLFGDILACPFQQPHPKDKTADKGSPQIQEMHEYGEFAYVGTNFLLPNPQKQFKSNDAFETLSLAASSSCLSCVLEFDGASKGNPGPSGAGALLRSEDGKMVCRLQEGVGIATNNVAEYRALILGLTHALKEGYKHIRVVGDSKLVCMQVQDLWKIKNQNMADLRKVAKELKDKFTSFHINHVLRELNFEADAQANQAINLRDGEVVEDCKKK